MRRYTLACHLWWGHGTERDFVAACVWYDKAKDQGALIVDVKTAESIDVSVFETLFEMPKPGVPAF